MKRDITSLLMVNDWAPSLLAPFTAGAAAVKTAPAGYEESRFVKMQNHGTGDIWFTVARSGTATVATKGVGHYVPSGTVYHLQIPFLQGTTAAAPSVNVFSNGTPEYSVLWGK